MTMVDVDSSILQVYSPLGLRVVSLWQPLGTWSEGQQPLGTWSQGRQPLGTWSEGRQPLGTWSEGQQSLDELGQLSK